MSQAPCGDIYVVGFFQEHFDVFTATDGEDGFIAKYTDGGVLKWVKKINGTSVNRLNGIVVKDDNQIYIAGEYKGTIYINNDSIVSQNQLEMMIMKMDSSGNTIWVNSGTGIGYESANDISLSDNGNLIVTGYFENDFTIDSTSLQSIGLRDVFVANFSSAGSLNWVQSFGGPAIEQGRSIRSDSANNIYVTGSFRDALFILSDTILSKGNYDVFLAKYDDSGQFQWIRTFGGFSVDEGACVNIDGNQDIYVAGWFNRSFFVDTLFVIGGQEDNAMLVKYNQNGDLLWAKGIGQNFDERAYKVAFDSDDNIFLMGTLDSFMYIGTDTFYNRHVSRPTDIFVAFYDKDGNYFWGQDLGYHYNDFCYDLLIEDATTFYIAGSFQDTTVFVTETIVSQNSYDVFLAKFNIDTTVAVRILPEHFQTVTKIEVYPNPSIIESVISYDLKKSAEVKISLIDLLGREKRTIFEDYQSPGHHNFPIYKQKDETGVYFLQLNAGNTVYISEILFIDQSDIVKK